MGDFSWNASRVIDPWNDLTEEEVSAPNTRTFKLRYDKAKIVRQRSNADGS